MTALHTLAQGGQCSALPDHTIEAILAGITIGADGLHVMVYPSAECEPVLRRSADLASTTDGSGRIEETPLADLRRLDAGHTFVINGDRPWQRNPARNYVTGIVTLEETLWWLPPGQEIVLDILDEGLPPDRRDRFVRRLVEILSGAAAELRASLVVPSAELAAQLGALIPTVPCWLRIRPGDDPAGYEALRTSGIRGVALSAECAFDGVASQGPLSPSSLLSHYGGHPDFAVAVSCSAGDNVEDIAAAVERLPFPCMLSSPFVDRVLLGRRSFTRHQDSFDGTEPDTTRWKFGFARIDNDETTIYQDNGFHIDIKEGDHYSGGSAVSVFPLVGDFSVEVEFSASNPHRANTLELAIINVSGDKHYTEVGKVSRFDDAFDVHSSPPFVCVENDEADGFRVMNNVGTWTWTNRYHRDVGVPACTQGSLRLDRRGAYFTGYYKDRQSGDWVGCGSAINQSLNNMVFVRIGAKHWPKGKPPLPASHVVFRNLQVSKYVLLL